MPSLVMLLLAGPVTPTPALDCTGALDEPETPLHPRCNAPGVHMNPTALARAAQTQGLTLLMLGTAGVVCPVVLLGAVGVMARPLVRPPPTGANLPLASATSSNGNHPCAVACNFCCGPPLACACQWCGVGFTQLLQCGPVSACVQTCVLCAFAAL